jgi:beta-mannosidase
VEKNQNLRGEKMREKYFLNGTWLCKPLAWTMVQKDGSEVTLNKQLPTISTMELPCNWHQGGLPHFFGRVSFQRNFQYNQKANDKVFLCFEGVDYRCQVLLNNNLVGKHEGCFQRFEMDVTTFLLNGENLVEVIVESPNEQPEDVWPHKKWLIKGIFSHWDAKPGGWDLESGQDGNTGGIWGDVYLESRSSLHIVHAKVHTQVLPKKTPDESHIIHWDDKNQIDATPKAYVWTNIRLSGAVPFDCPVTIQVSFTDEDGVSQKQCFDYTGSDEHVGLLLIKEPKLWWTWDLGHPHLYKLTVSISQKGQILDEQEYIIGLREIDFEPETGIWKINGVRQFIRGTNVIPTLWLGEYNNDKINQDIKLLRDANVNGVRVCVHVNRKEWYEACDRAGLVVWQDFMLQWGYANHVRVVESAIKQIKDMIRQLYNHPSIGVWCCQNESLFFNNEVVGPQLARAAKEEDSSRFVHPTSEFSEHPYSGWYGGHYKQFEELPGGRLVTEFGAQALPSVEEVIEMNGSSEWPPNWEKLGYHNFQYEQTFYTAYIDHGENWDTFVENSQTYQSKLLKLSIESYRKSKFEKVGSMFQFMFMDAWPSITWSVISHKRKPKKGYFTLKQVFQPVLVGVDISDHWPAKKPFGGGEEYMSFSPWIINDFPKLFENCHLQVKLCNKSNGIEKVLSEQTVTIQKDSFAFFDQVRFKNYTFDAGKYEMVLTIEHDGQCLSINRYDIRID